MLCITKNVCMYIDMICIEVIAVVLASASVVLSVADLLIKFLGA